MGRILVKDLRQLIAHNRPHALHARHHQINRLVTTACKTVFDHDGSRLNVLRDIAPHHGLHIQHFSGDSGQFILTNRPQSPQRGTDSTHSFSRQLCIRCDTGMNHVVYNPGIPHGI